MVGEHAAQDQQSQASGSGSASGSSNGTGSQTESKAQRHSKRPGLWDAAFREEEAYQAASVPLSEMPSCMNLFDDWATCFALGKQLRYIYRYGTPTDCAAKAEAFRYCLSLKGMSEEERHQAWTQRRAETITSKRLTQSSEDIWESRESCLTDPPADTEASSTTQKSWWPFS